MIFIFHHFKNFLKSIKFNYLDPGKGYFKNSGIIFSSKSVKELTIKSQCSPERFPTLPQPKKFFIPSSNSLSR